LVTGGCGYKGSVLVPKLLKAGYDVLVVDSQWFGRNLENHPRLEVLQKDIRGDISLDGVTKVIHLAGIANDPCGELDTRLTWDVNVLATLKLAEECVKAKVSQFIFASSASVYGIKGNDPVKEETSFEPVSDYNKTKMIAERLLSTFTDYMSIVCVRPATVCGLSPRMRLDVVVNMLTAQALEKGEITAHCGPHGRSLMRPHMHIEDVTDLYLWFLKHPYLKGAYNAASDNQSIGETAEVISKEIPCKITYSQVADKRSYVVDYSKLLTTGFKPKKSVLDAVRDIADAWRLGFRRNEKMMNLAWMRSQGFLNA
jgi:nucleoside-diphosphate-sugar epimerase